MLPSIKVPTATTSATIAAAAGTDNARAAASANLARSERTEVTASQGLVRRPDPPVRGGRAEPRLGRAEITQPVAEGDPELEGVARLHRPGRLGGPVTGAAGRHRQRAHDLGIERRG